MDGFRFHEISVSVGMCTQCGQMVTARVSHTAQGADGAQLGRLEERLARACPLAGFHVCKPRRGAKRAREPDWDLQPQAQRASASAESEEEEEEEEEEDGEESSASEEEEEESLIDSESSSSSAAAPSPRAAAARTPVHKHSRLVQYIEAGWLRHGDLLAVGRGPQPPPAARLVQHDKRYFLERLDKNSTFVLSLDGLWRHAFPDGPRVKQMRSVWRVRGGVYASLGETSVAPARAPQHAAAKAASPPPAAAAATPAPPAAPTPVSSPVVVELVEPAPPAAPTARAAGAAPKTAGPRPAPATPSWPTSRLQPLSATTAARTLFSTPTSLTLPKKPAAAAAVPVRVVTTPASFTLTPSPPPAAAAVAEPAPAPTAVPEE
jgi:hypothetical protein